MYDSWKISRRAYIRKDFVSDEEMYQNYHSLFFDLISYSSNFLKYKCI